MKKRLIKVILTISLIYFVFSTGQGFGDHLSSKTCLLERQYADTETDMWGHEDWVPISDWCKTEKNLLGLVGMVGVGITIFGLYKIWTYE